MTATNHALTGAVIGALVGQPLLALPIAFASHYAVDAIPHFGLDERFIETQTFRWMLSADALFCILLTAVLAALHPAHWPVMAICAFLATSPDLFWLNKYRYARRGTLQDWHPNAHSRFASRIQWFEKPIGAATEIVWFVAGAAILASLLAG